MSKGGASIPDEEWERFLREAEAGGGGAPEEPSARARMVAQRLQEESGPPEGWRTYTPARRRRGKGWAALGLAAAVAVVVVAVGPWGIGSWFDGDDGASAAPLAAESERPTGAPAQEAADRPPTLNEPFRGSPAARWSDGTAGIHLPEPRATGWMSRAEVADALAKTRDFLAASSLDPAVLRGERPTEAIALINPHQADVRGFLGKALRAPDRENDPLLLFSRFRSSEVRPAGDVVKTRGRVTFREGERGAVQVSTDVTYVYPVVRAEGDSDEVARTIVRREVVMSWDDPAKIVIEPGTFSLVSYKVDTTNGGCDTHTGYLTPAFLAERTDAEARDGAEVDPYDRSTSMAERMREGDEEGCGTATRS
ncbi:hypothetical protein N7925_32940 [Streptomyces sp. CA-278952]|uniref:hypothetical protein n=1 Tax=unclassified Streptomyces TaxID=2593676 RepID=UPI0022425C96|nr:MULTISPECIES: hypothetical protein [unclassified Streptomyces]UZI32920.1 hypothetical protein OH133_35195 [Streptomyces sp. VB1]WDG32798.1 hypothetical protein N7925_32940 [Streptomyces sp. CA-278952]